MNSAAVANDETGLVEEVWQRQRRIAELMADRVLVREGSATSPLVTGVGSEHPLENGFAFLDPYGTPYLSGSSVKGVLRRAAEELTLFESNSEWDVLALWWLFGFDATSAFVETPKRIPENLDSGRGRWRRAFLQACERVSPDEVGQWLNVAADSALSPQWRKDPIGFVRSLADDGGESAARNVHSAGSLRFWDVLVRPPRGGKGELRVDIMNPHHHKYYQDGEPPGDFRGPNPIFFLAVRPGAQLTFVVELAPGGALPERIEKKWQSLIDGALHHACDCLGFGAKTAVGYGAVRLESSTRIRASTPRTPTAPEIGARAALDSFLMELKALSPARVPGAISGFVQVALTMFSGEEQREAARAIVDKVTVREARKRAKHNQSWSQVLELAGRSDTTTKSHGE